MKRYAVKQVWKLKKEHKEDAWQKKPLQVFYFGRKYYMEDSEDMLIAKFLYKRKTDAINSIKKYREPYAQKQFIYYCYDITNEVIEIEFED